MAPTVVEVFGSRPEGMELMLGVIVCHFHDARSETLVQSKLLF